MATAQTSKTVEPAAAPKAKRQPTSMVDRMKAQLSAAAFKAIVDGDDVLKAGLSLDDLQPDLRDVFGTENVCEGPYGRAIVTVIEDAVWQAE